MSKQFFGAPSMVRTFEEEARYGGNQFPTITIVPKK